MPTLIVRGKVVTPAGEPLDSKVVRILPRLSANTYGAPASTLTTAGVYTATYTTTGSEPAFDVEIVVAETTGAELGRSVLLYGVSGEITVDLVIGEDSYRGRSEFRQIDAQIGTLRGTLQVEELGSEHIEYLAAKLDMDPLRIAQYIQAHRLNLFVNEDISRQVFYALLRQGLPSNFPRLLAQGRLVHARAITAAIAANVVSNDEVGSLEPCLDHLEDYTATTATWVDATNPNLKSKFRRILDTASGSEAAPAKQLLFIKKHLAHTGTLAEFWDAVEADVDLGPAVRATYQWTIQIDSLANDHMPLIAALQARREDVGDPIKSFRDLASLDVDDWVELLSDDTLGPAIGAPPAIPAEWPEVDRIQRYAETLERIIADTYPTAVIHKRIERDQAASPGSIAGALDLIQFFADNPAFELLPHDLNAYLADHPGALAGVADGAAATANIKKLQRLSRVAPRGFHYRVVKPLYQAGIHSGHQISRMSQANFVRTYAGSVGGEDIAGAVYQNAAQAASYTLALAARFSAAFNPIGVPRIPRKMEDLEGHPDLKAIFGNLDFCACEHCRSVFSAAAYYVDLLHFLENQPGKVPEDHAIDALTERRPELAFIELSCINTNTEVPYIDLVNEVLEYHVAGNADEPAENNAPWQTTWTAEELAIRPEHRLDAAYNNTWTAVVPWLLPFNLPLAETTHYHRSFDVSRERMLKAYPVASDYQDKLARARLGLDVKTWKIIIDDASLSEEPWDYWRVTDEEAEEAEDPEDEEKGWWELLRPISTFLKRSDLNIKDLAALLRTRFVGRIGLSIAYSEPPEDCDLDLAKMATLGAEDLDKFHRFIRLQRKIGWTVEELDVALHALGGEEPVLDAVMVRKLAVVHRLKERLRLPVDTLLTLWSPLTTHRPADDETKPSFYAARFINRLLDEPGSSKFALLENLTGLADEDDGLASEPRIATVQAALGISAQQAVYLENWIAAEAATTLAVLSKAHRRVILARALGISLVELRCMMDVLATSPETSPFIEGGAAPTEADLAVTESFLEGVDAIRSSGFTSEQIAYLLKHTTPLTPGVAPLPDVRAPMLKDLAKGLADIDAKYTIDIASLGEGPLGDSVRAALAEILMPEELEAAMTLLNLTTEEDLEQKETRINAHLAPSNPDPFPFFADLALAVDNLAKPNPPGLATRIERYEYVLTELFAALRKRSSRDLVVQRFAAHFGIAAESMRALLLDYLVTPAPILDFFTDELWFDEDGSPNSAANSPYERVHKSALVISGFELDAADLHYLFGDGVTGWLDLDALPSDGEPAPLLFVGFRRLLDYTRARAMFPHHPTTMAELRLAGSMPSIIDILAPRLGWSAADINRANFFVHDFGWDDYNDEVALLIVAETITVARQLHATVTTVQGWSFAEPQNDQAMAMRKALRGRYDESTWRGVAQSIQDELRIQQRDALVAYLIKRGVGPDLTPVASADELYAYLLMDVEMSVCMKTSRIRFALNAVQQFVQRVFLALEDDLIFDDSAESRWVWMKHYRLWEANRKVFLYPENWIDPTLRGDKSPFFRELEDSLLQGDITKSIAESAYVAYLEKLQAVAIPEVMGMYHEYQYDLLSKELLNNDLHVVARTGHGPYRHVYRKRHDLRRWTAWEELPGDIKSEHILPMVYGRRLYVFWVEFQLVNVAPPNDTLTEDNAKTPDMRLVAQLYWVEKHDGSWTSRFHAEGCELEIMSSAGGTTIETCRKWFFCKAVERPLTQRLEISVCWGETSALSPVPGLGHLRNFIPYDLGRFVLDPRSGKFATEIHLVKPGQIQGIPRTQVGQRWNSVSQGGASADFAIRTVDGDFYTHAQLFKLVKPAYSVLFQHDHFDERLSDGGFFLSAKRHQFYVVPQIIFMGGWGGGSSEDGGLDEPRPNVGSLFPWKSFALVPTAAEASAPEYPLDESRSLLSADSLSVPLKWKGKVPGVLHQPLPMGLVSGQASAHVTAHNAVASELLDTPSTSQANQVPGDVSNRELRVFVFQHTYVGTLLGQIRRYGVEGLLRPLSNSEANELSRQKLTEVAVPQLDEWNSSLHDYQPGSALIFPKDDEPIPDDIDFSYEGPLSLYNWEIFFHAPLLISDILSRQGRYEEADSWLRGIFDPMATDIPDENRFWRLKPFFAQAEVPSINELLLLLQGIGDQGGEQTEFEYQVEEWLENPFNPHAIARLRLGAYQWATVMRYLDNLIAWGDARFAEDTIESINEATQIYMLAKSILGDRPVEVKKTIGPAVKTYDQIHDVLDSFSNALVELETKKIKAHSENLSLPITVFQWWNSAPQFWYFCVPGNPKVLAYWDVVDDRLFKIRHCQDIHGIERRLALFDPPIDPGQVVKAVAGGDLASALSRLAGRAPVYRFQTYLSKAYELASEVKALGSGLLQAYEKRDGEDLSLLRSQHERSVLALARAVREAQIVEADQSLRAAESARPITVARQAYYQGLVDAGWIASEQAQVDLQKYAMTATLAAGLASLLGAGLGLIPNFDGGVSGVSSPVIKASFGGQQLAAVAGLYAGIFQLDSSLASMEAGLAGTTAGYERRMQDWKQQVANAALELSQIDQQIEAARARKVVSEKELRSHDLQVQNAEVVDAFMRAKYTNTELYGWMIAKVSSLYKQAYELAYRAAVAAEKAYQYELHSDESFIGFGYWDQSRSGLLAGEILALDLRRLDAAYLDNNTREYELIKRVSLAQLDPYALVQLRETGSCYMNVPEYLFDLDHPGHYLRRIKMVSVALPGVTGPHVSVGCTLTLESSKTRVSPSLAPQYPEDVGDGLDGRFTYRVGKVEQVATSSGQDSTGMFESNINDARYLPFEGAGAISMWRIDLPGAKRQFDYRTIADVVVTIQYTARGGGGALRTAALGAAEAAANAHKNSQNEPGAALILRAATDFSAAWHKFLYSETASSIRELDMDIVAERFPYLAATWPDLKIKAVRLILVTDLPLTVGEIVELERDGVSVDTLNLVSTVGVLGALPTGRWSDEMVGRDPGPWKVKVDAGDVTFPIAYRESYQVDGLTYYRFKDSTIRDMLIIVQYELQPPP